MNPFLDTSKIEDTSKKLKNGMFRNQILFLWTGKPPFAQEIHTPAFSGDIGAQKVFNDYTHLMIGRYPPPNEDEKHFPLAKYNAEAMVFYQSLSGFEVRTPIGVYRYLRPHVALEVEREARKYGGAPLIENRIDYNQVDWSQPNATLARMHGVSRQTIAAQRKRHGVK